MRKPIIKICEWCGKEFQAKTIYVKTCCSKCSRALAVKTCNERGNHFKRVYNVDDNFLQKESPEKYYYLGLMASDGNLSECTKSISLGQSGEEGKKCLDYVKTILKAENPFHVYNPSKGKRGYSISIRSKQLWNDLCDNNVTPRKTYTYTIPEYILQDENKLRYFLIGYIDGDGSIGVYKNMLVISFVGTSTMIEQIKTLILFKDAHYHQGCGGNVIECRFNGINAINFGEWLYRNITVFKSYKYNKFKNYMDNRYEISERLFLTEQRNKIFEYLDRCPNTSSGELQEIFNIDKEKSYQYKYKWRKKNGYI